MRKRTLTAWLCGALAAAALAAAVSAPAEVLENLEFFSDLELLSNLELLEDDGGEAAVAASTFTAVSSPAVAGSSQTIKISTLTWRPYEKR